MKICFCAVITISKLIFDGLIVAFITKYIKNNNGLNAI